jgi:hypothetical protein
LPMPAQVLDRLPKRQAPTDPNDGDPPAPSGDGSSPLRRPKVGADMPVGRPSWFHVPAPSQGAFRCVCYRRWFWEGSRAVISVVPRASSYIVHPGPLVVPRIAPATHARIFGAPRSQGQPVREGPVEPPEPEPQHRVRGGAVPEHWRVLERRDGDHHAAGGHVHARVPVLRGQDRRPAPSPRPVRALQGTEPGTENRTTGAGQRPQRLPPIRWLCVALFSAPP